MSAIRTKLRLKRPRIIETDKAPKKKRMGESVFTPAELAFKQHQQKYFDQGIEEKIKVTHKDRVEKFNKQLTDLAEQYDIPRVGPG